MPKIPTFTLWLEFEAVDPDNWDTLNDFANIHVDLPDGRHYGINVWTYNYFKEATKHTDIYLTPPDLFVKELTRECIQVVIAHLLTIGNLENVLNPSVLNKS